MEKRQRWHTDFHPEKVDGADHLSVIFALDDGVILPVIGDAQLANLLPVHSSASEPTVSVHVPKGCVSYSAETQFTPACTLLHNLRNMHQRTGEACGESRHSYKMRCQPIGDITKTYIGLSTVVGRSHIKLPSRRT